MIKILLGLSGWLATIFILGFFAALFSLLNIDKPPLKIIGITLIISAFFILRRHSNEFLENFALAISLTGQVLLTFGLYDSFRYLDNPIFSDLQLVWIVVASFSVLLALIMPSYIHRVCSSFVAAIGFAIVLYFSSNSFYTTSLYGAFLMLITALIWLNEFKFSRHIEKLQAIGYGLIIALIALKGTNLFFTPTPGLLRIEPLYEIWLQPWKPWIRESLLSAVMVFVAWKMVQKIQPKPSKINTLLAIFGALLLSLLSYQAQGISIGVMVILLGFSASNRMIIGLGIISLLFFISSYYYLLQNTLLEKSITLFILGVALILARWIMGYLSSNKIQGAEA